MKKTISLILTALLVMSALASCMNESDPSVSADSQLEESENSEETSDISEDDENNEYLDTVVKIDSALKYGLPANCAYTNIINGNTYSINLEPYKHYPDDGKKLTDNDDAALSETEKWVGFLGRNDIEITVDLGGLQTNLGGFSINSRYEVNAGENIPKVCQLWISTDGEEYIKIATSEKYPDVLSGSRVYTHSAYTQKGFDAAYIKIVLTGFVSQWTTVDAIKVYRITATEDNGDYYINDPMPDNITPTYWDASDEDYATYQNLIKGLDQRVYAGFNLEIAHRTDYYNTPASSKLLTDGKRGGTSYADAAYFHATKGLWRSFVYDLGKLSELSKAVVGIYVLTDYGIHYPDNISVMLSEDGENWQTVIYKSANQFPNAVQSRVDVTLDFDGSYKARFIKFVLTIPAHAWLDELEVWGTKSITEAAKTIIPETTNVYDKGYPSAESLGGCENILLAYNYKTENVSAGRTTKKSYLPYVGYYNTDGELTDYFFDSYLYLPCMTTCPSGGFLYSSADKPSVMSDWLDYENDLFYDDANVHALEQAVGEVKTALGDSDYQVKVFLSIFNPNVKCKSFGDVDGDGNSENMSVAEDRRTVVKWWIDRQIERYDSCNFTNQKLVGFYWYDEALDFSDSLNKDTLFYAIDYVHTLGYYIIWIPYYQASGFTQWEQVGFDAANMQPNYMFKEESTQQILYDNAALAKMYGMGVEIEIQGKALSDPEYHDRYTAYLKAGVECGYMNSVKMYYQDAGPGVFYSAYASNDPYVRAIYDITYQYAKGILELGNSDSADSAISTARNTKYQGEVTLKNGICLGASVAQCAKYGSITVSNDGKIIYTPMENFTGTDTFILNISDGVETSQVIYTVNVHK
ncbi:MAG: DUF4855 domain-containing protein [Eubacteriales bacterium]|nr:DUF4855 domain-containing protein [Eubacteriales bacterium]